MPPVCMSGGSDLSSAALQPVAKCQTQRRQSEQQRGQTLCGYDGHTYNILFLFSGFASIQNS